MKDPGEYGKSPYTEASAMPMRNTPRVASGDGASPSSDIASTGREVVGEKGKEENFIDASLHAVV